MDTNAKRIRRSFKFIQGLTLIEILFAIGILAFALCGIAATFTSAMVLNTTSKNINIADEAAMGLMEQIRMDAFPQIKNDYDGLTFTVNALPQSMGVVYVNATNPELLQVTISVSWRQGNRIIGEDANLNGVLNAGEDTNANGILDSPVELVTRIANR